MKYDLDAYTKSKSIACLQTDGRFVTDCHSGCCTNIRTLELGDIVNNSKGIIIKDNHNNYLVVKEIIYGGKTFQEACIVRNSL